MGTSDQGAPATLHDVAREAGVSLATASRSLNGSTRKVNEELRQRVLETAARLDYSPNLSAQAIARGTSTTVALLVADIADPYFSQIAAGVVAAADAERLIVTMAATEGDATRELELVRTLRGQRPRAMILAGSRAIDEPSDGPLGAELAAYERAGGHVVLISRNEYGFRTVLLDNRAGAAALATALAGLGYRRFAVITGGERLRTAADRLEGFRDGLAGAGIELPEDAVLRADFTRDGGYAATAALLGRGLGEVDIVIAANDVMAIGALSAIRDAGLEPGRDVAVAGFDDIPTARDVTPALTSVRVPLVELGRLALRRALDDAGPAAAAEVGTEVVLRASTPGR